MKKFYFFLVALVLGAMSSSAAYYLAGGFNSWNAAATGYAFTDNGDGTYTYNYDGELAESFKITDGSWGTSWGGVDTSTPVSGQTISLTTSNGKDIKFATALSNPTLVFNPTANTLVVTGEEAEVEYTYLLHGTLPAGGSTWVDVELTQEAGTNNWVLADYEVTAQSSFGIKQMYNGNQAAWINASGTSTISGEGEYACKVQGTNFTITPGTYTLTYDADAMNLIVTGAGEELVVTYYLIGDFNTWTSADEACKFVQSEDNKDEYILDYVGDISTIQGFKVNDGTWTNPSFNFGSNGANMVPGESYTYSIGDSTENMFVSIGVTNPRFVLNPSAQTLTIASWTAVEDIEIEENVAPVYYNLQGVQVAEPANGLYIVVRGDKVSKELVK